MRSAPKDCIFQLRLSKLERNMLELIAEEYGTSLSQAVRTLIRREAKRAKGQ